MTAYIKEDVEAMLRQHKENEAKLTEIELKIEEYQERYDYAGTVCEDTDKEVIESMQVGSQAYDAIHSNTNKITDKVINTVMNYKKEQRYINKEDRSFLERKITELIKERNILDKRVVRVKNLLNRINKEEKFVIDLYYLEEAKWDYVEKEYFNEFEKHKSIKQLQTYRDIALEKMLKILNI